MPASRVPGRYGFNRSHAVSYALIAFQTAYLKTHWSLEFMTALMNADSKDIDRISFLVVEAKKLGIEVLPPDINQSNSDFTPLHKQKNKEIRFGLGSIKNVGYPVVASIIKERSKNGPFLSFSDFLDRIHNKDLNKKSLEALIKAGALDGLGERKQMLENIQRALSYNKEAISAKQQGQGSLFTLVDNRDSIPSLNLVETESASMDELLRWEKKYVGLYISGHPLHKFQNKIKKFSNTIEKIKTMPPGTSIRGMAAMIAKVKKIITKKRRTNGIYNTKRLDW